MDRITRSLPTQAHILEETEQLTEFPFPPMDAVEPTSSPSDTPPSRSRSSLSRSPRSSLSPPPRHTRTRGERDRRERDREREREHSGGRSKLLSRLISREEHEATQVRTLLVLANDRLESETRRAEDAERRVVEVLHKLRAAHEATMLAQADAARANEELRLYKYRLEDAQREITRAQEIVNDVEQARAEAEAEAARARSTARRFREERLMAQAREEGRRQGYKEGLTRGKDMGYYDARSTEQEEPRRYGRRPILVEQISDEDDDDEPQSPVVVSPIPRSPIRPDWRPPSRSTTTASRTERRSPPDRQDDPIAIPRSPIRIRSPRHGPRPQPDNIVPVAGPSHSRSHEDDPIVPIPIHNPSPSPSHPAVDIPPDNWIPVMDRDNEIHLPPPHELSRPVSPNSVSSNLPHSAGPLPQAPHESSVRTRDFAYHHPPEPPNVARSGFAAPMSPSSRTSTNISQYDLVSSRAGTSASSRLRNTMGTLAGIIGSPNTSRPRTPAGSSREDRHTKSRGSSHRKNELTVPVHAEDSFSGAGPAAEREHRARSPLERLFKKRYRNRTSAGSSNGTPDIVVESPTTRSNSRPSTVGAANEPNLLSPEVSYTPLAAPDEAQFEATADQRPLPALPELGLTTPGVTPIPDSQLPPGFVPYGTPVLAPPEEIPSFAGDYDRGANKSPYRSGGSPKPGPLYAEAPIPPNVVYPDPPGRKATPGGPDRVALPPSPPHTSPPGSRRRGSLGNVLSPLSLRLSPPHSP